MRTADELVDAAIRAGKLRPADSDAAEDRAYANPTAFEAEIAATASVVPLGEIGHDKDIVPMPAIELGPIPDTERPAALSRSATTTRPRPPAIGRRPPLLAT